MKGKIVKYIPFLILGIPCCISMIWAGILFGKYPALNYYDYLPPVMGRHLSIVTLLVSLVLYLFLYRKYRKKILFHVFFISSAGIMSFLYFSVFPRFTTPLPSWGGYNGVFNLVNRIHRVRKDMRILGRALEDYHKDHGAYPPWDIGEKGENWFVRDGLTFSENIPPTPTFKLGVMTTPINYLEKYRMDTRPADPFADHMGFSYCYYSDRRGYILFSWGPDVDESSPDEWDLAADVQKVFHSDVKQPSLELLTGKSSRAKGEAYSYDPSNGLISPGDIWYVRLADDESGVYSLR